MTSSEQLTSEPWIPDEPSDEELARLGASRANGSVERERVTAATVAAEPASAPIAADPFPPSRHHSDLGNAERLVDRHGHEVRYCHPWGRWLVYDGRRWASDDTGRAEQLLKSMLRALVADAHELDDDDERKRLLKHVLDSERAPRLRGALELARSEPGIPVLPAQLDADPWLLNVENGTIDLRTGTLRPHWRDDLLSKLAPVRFDPQATAPHWTAFLERVLPDPKVREFLQCYIGYALAGVTVEQLIAILYGTGANGKTTFVETLLELLGDYGQAAPAETFLEHRETIPNDVARLRGARLVAACELGEGRRLNETLVKRMTGGDRLTARFMRGEWFEFTPEFSVLLATNHKPIVRGTDDAIWRRIRLVPFTVKIPPEERNLNLRDTLRGEFPGILRWAVDGCLSWQQDGLGTAEAVTKATADYREESDLLGAFLQERCVIAGNASATAGDLHRAYVEWCQTNGIQPLAQRTLGLRLNERGFVRNRTESVRWWTGIGIRPQTG